MYMTQEIGTLTKATINKPKPKDIVSLNSAQQATCSLALANKTSDCIDSFLTMEDMLR
jgi:hypothetical protein